MELKKFYSLLENAATVEEEVFDIRFEEVVSLVEQEKFKEAIPLITTILNEGSIDIRLVMYLFYANFLEKGISGLREIFPALITMLDEHWERISPSQMRDKHALSSLTWFLSSIVKKLKRSEKLYKEKKADEFWTRSVESLSLKDIEALKTTAHRLGKLLIQQLEEPSLNQYLMFISKWLDGLQNVVADAAEAEPQIADKKADQPLPESAPPPSSSSDLALGLQEILSSSEHMNLLYKKIQLFEALIEKQDFEKAALIADDISTTIKNFDPTLFFPKLFSRYFALTATHIETLSEEWNNKTSLKWEALTRLYQTDIEEFIQW